MMNRLECQVASCRHYSDSLCCLSGITVDGPTARVSDQTCCASFEERQGEGATNAAGQRPSYESAIVCAVDQCAYNRDRRCHADRVYVGNSSGAASSKSGTECQTFRLG